MVYIGRDILKRLIIIIVVFFLIFSSVSAANFVDLDGNIKLSEYWGCKNLKLTNGTGFFDTYQDGNDKWWFVDPEGYAFYSVGVCAVSPFFRYVYNESIIKKYGDYEDWANATVDRFKDWGFNTLGAWSEYSLFSKTPYTYTLISRKDEKWNIARRHPDVFDPGWQLHIKEQIEGFTKILKDDPYLIGYWLDNEMNWSPDYIDRRTLLEEYILCQYDERIRPGKTAAITFLKERYDGDVDEFNSVWKMNIKSFDDLYEVTSLGRTGCIAQHISKKIEGDVKAFYELVAETYFSIITSLIRENDPNHLILGVRFHLQGASEEVIRACGKYCDVVSINYYHKHILIYDPIKYLQCYLYGSVPLDKWMKRYYEISEKPLIIGEFSCRSLDSGLEKNRVRGSMVAINQKNRANYFKWYAKNCLESPYIVGYHWFAYIDKVIYGVDSNCGLVNKYDEEYDFVNYLSEINNKVYDLH